MKLGFWFICAAISADGAYYEGEFCDANGAPGTCKNIRVCPSAQDEIRKGNRPFICEFSGSDPIVCCRNNQPALTTTRRPQASTTGNVPEEAMYSYEDVSNNDGPGGCEPIPPALTSKPTGQKAWDKCIEYQEKYVFPCEKAVELSGNFSRVNRCHHNSEELIIHLRENAYSYEFPHMVLLGYYDDQQRKIDYECGGTLISEKYVLTAGHCITNVLRNNVSHALVGILKRSQESSSNRYGVRRIIKHAGYQSPGKYNDIALLELDREVPLSHTVVPACLDTGYNVDDSRAFVTGWGDTVYNSRGSKVDTLQKLFLTKFTTEECSSKFEANHHMLKRVDPNSQVCYGDRTKSRDTCQGDSGGPLQVKNKKIVCMYTVVGVTSFRKACGLIGEPGIYTRVANYLPWIESIVWPN